VNKAGNRREQGNKKYKNIYGAKVKKTIQKNTKIKMSNNHFNKKANVTVDKYELMHGSLYELYTMLRGLLRNGT
jgi:hypothetical protein